jgi:hypothetical protein
MPLRIFISLSSSSGSALARLGAGATAGIAAGFDRRANLHDALPTHENDPQPLGPALTPLRIFISLSSDVGTRYARVTQELQPDPLGAALIAVRIFMLRSARTRSTRNHWDRL